MAAFAVALVVLPAGAASASTRTFAVASASGKSLTFRVSGVRPGSVQSGRVVAGERSWRVSARSLRRQISKGRVRTRAPKLRRGTLRTARLQLKTRTPKPPKGSPTAPTAPAPTEPAPTAPAPTTPTEPAPTNPTSPAPNQPAPVAPGLRPVGAQPLADSDAAALVRPAAETRLANAAANLRRPTSAELTLYRSAANDLGACNHFHQKVTGNYSGTTDEIIQWAAAKWGFDAATLRAVATIESNWLMSAVGDGGVSYGLMQIKSTAWRGTAPLSFSSTAFNADFYGAILRYYFNGCATWLNDEDRGKDYAAGDLRGSIGAWYSGRWHYNVADYLQKFDAALAAL